jgi:hypothetical protein
MGSDEQGKANAKSVMRSVAERIRAEILNKNLSK